MSMSQIDKDKFTSYGYQTFFYNYVLSMEVTSWESIDNESSMIAFIDKWLNDNDSIYELYGNNVVKCTSKTHDESDDWVLIYFVPVSIAIDQSTIDTIASNSTALLPDMTAINSYFSGLL